MPCAARAVPRAPREERPHDATGAPRPPFEVRDRVFQPQLARELDARLLVFELWGVPALGDDVEDDRTAARTPQAGEK